MFPPCSTKSVITELTKSVPCTDTEYGELCRERGTCLSRIISWLSLCTRITGNNDPGQSRRFNSFFPERRPSRDVFPRPKTHPLTGVHRVREGFRGIAAITGILGLPDQRPHHWDVAFQHQARLLPYLWIIRKGLPSNLNASRRVS
jgi:hypothetical protein